MKKIDCSVHYFKVRKIMEHFGQACADAPTMPDEETRLLRARLMMEEVLETVRDGLGVSVTINAGEYNVDFPSLGFEINGPGNLVELADGCADVKVVTTGTLIAAGIADLPLQHLIDENNLTKMGGPVVNGKFQKPPGYKPPDVKGLLEREQADSFAEMSDKMGALSDTKVYRDPVEPLAPDPPFRNPNDSGLVLDERDFLTRQQAGVAGCDPNKPDCESCQ